MRLFVGVALPEPIRDEIAGAAASWREMAPELKWVDPALYHLTLQFLGELPAETATELKLALAALPARSAFRLRLGAVMTLPRGSRARVLALSLTDGFEPLHRLARAVSLITRKHGVPREGRPYRAHLTLARARRGERLPADLDPAGLAAPPLPAWDVCDFHLYQSELRPGGPLYTSLARFELSPGGLAGC